MGQLFAAVVTGISFGLWHNSVSQVFFAAILGIFLCLIFEKTQSILCAMFVHFANNLMVFLMRFVYAQLGSLLQASDKVFMIQAMFHKHTVFSVVLILLMIWMLSVMVAAPIMLIVQIVKKRKGLGLSRGEFPYNAWKKTLVFFSAPLTVIIFAVMFLFTFVF